MNKFKYIPVLVFLLCYVQGAYAYIDPGTGAFVVQMIVAALAGALFYWRKLVVKIKSLLRIKSDEAKKKTSEPEKESSQEKDNAKS